MKIKIEGEKLLFIDFPFKTKEVGITQTPTGSYICRTKSTTQIDQLN